jgi:hypothetical protein
MSKPIYAGVTKPDYSIPDGKYPARLVQIIQIGNQMFGKATNRPWYSPQILLGFEFPTLTYENRDGEEVSNIKSATYFLSMNQAKSGQFGLREIIDGLRGSSEYTEEELEKFDITSFLGKECMVTLSGVESKGQVYQNITGVEPFTTGDGDSGMLQKYREPVLVTVDDFKDLDSLDLPEWIKNKIMDSQEYQEQFSAGKAPINEPYKTPEEAGDKEIKIEDVPF